MPGTRVAVCACAALGQPRALDFISFVDFAFFDEYVHSLTSRSLAFFIELRAEVDHTNIMS